MPSRSTATSPRCCAPQFADARALQLHEADALEFDFAALAAQRAAAGCAWSATCPTTSPRRCCFTCWRNAGALIDLHVMLQREVVARAWPPGPATRDYGRLTVMLAPWVQIERLFDVGPGAFQPPPRVWSAVVRLTVRATPLFAVSPHYARGGGRRLRAAAQDAAQCAERAAQPAKQISACGIDPGRARRDARARGIQQRSPQTLDRAVP